MLEINFGDIREHLGKWLDAAKIEPVRIMRSGTCVAVLMSVEEFERYEHLKQAFVRAQSDDSPHSRHWIEQEKASRLACELPKRSKETDG